MPIFAAAALGPAVKGDAWSTTAAPCRGPAETAVIVAEALPIARARPGNAFLMQPSLFAGTARFILLLGIAADLRGWVKSAAAPSQKRSSPTENDELTTGRRRAERARPPRPDRARRGCGALPFVHPGHPIARFSGKPGSAYDGLATVLLLVDGVSPCQFARMTAVRARAPGLCRRTAWALLPVVRAPVTAAAAAGATGAAAGGPPRR